MALATVHCPDAGPRIQERTGRAWLTRCVVIRNEVSAMMLCHNIVVVIHEMHELGIEPTFEKREPEPAILKFPGVA
jgi:hypothetical protein